MDRDMQMRPVRSCERSDRAGRTFDVIGSHMLHTRDSFSARLGTVIKEKENCEQKRLVSVSQRSTATR